MSDNETAAPTGGAPEEGKESQTTDSPQEEISYHAVEKDGVVTAIWEMQGRKHIRTIDPRSRQGQDILRLYTTEHHDEAAPTSEAAPSGEASQTSEAAAASDSAPTSEAASTTS